MKTLSKTAFQTKILTGTAFPLILTMLLMGACDRSETFHSLVIFVTREGAVGIDYEHGFDSAYVKLYLSESDYLSNQNVYKEGITDSKGYLVFPDNTSIEDMWYRVTYRDWNNLRFQDTNGIGCCSRSRANKGNWLISRDVIHEDRGINVRLSSTPTTLEITALESLSPADSVTVQLYLSEDDYKNKITPENVAHKLNGAYGDWSNETDYALSNSLSREFKGSTDEYGKITLNNLEPRQYWFRLNKNGKTNAGGTITTNGPLPDNPDITTSITVEIM
ncbi:MAG: hypothetical protein OEX02_10300 [Cyclobacteriaceae bacterium]|nr:hypothetical protein [Cyclobacteriaceae bacterium]